MDDLATTTTTAPFSDSEIEAIKKHVLTVYKKAYDVHEKKTQNTANRVEKLDYDYHNQPLQNIEIRDLHSAIIRGVFSQLAGSSSMSWEVIELLSDRDSGGYQLCLHNRAGANQTPLPTPEMFETALQSFDIQLLSDHHSMRAILANSEIRHRTVFDPFAPDTWVGSFIASRYVLANEGKGAIG